MEEYALGNINGKVLDGIVCRNLTKDAMYHAAGELYLAGYGVQEIADKFNLKYSTLYNGMYRLGYLKNKREVMRWCLEHWHFKTKEDYINEGKIILNKSQGEKFLYQL